MERQFSEDWKTLKTSEKTFFMQQTVNSIATDLKRKIRDNFFLNKTLTKNNDSSEKKKTSLISHHYTGSSRYSWKGYEKNLLYFLDKKNNGEYFLFFFLSDVADKTNFIEATFIFVFVLILSNFLIAYCNYIINIKKQVRVNKKISLFI